MAIYWFKSISYIAACVLFLQFNIVDAVPVNQPRELLHKRATSSLHGKFLHITDIHLDTLYKEGADPKSLCHTHGKKRSKDSGKFGALGSQCDSPTALIDATFAFLKSTLSKVDFILYTGDTARHDRDNNLPRTNAEVIDGHKAIMKYFQSAYNIKNTPYLPTIGNNDAFDHNDVTKKDKIFGELETIWKPLSLNLTSTFSSGGYFAQDIIKGKLSVISTNSMYFFDKNKAVDDCSSSSSAAAVQMKWLDTTLSHYAKTKGQQVYIISHVPPVDDDGSQLYKSKCYSQYINLLGKYGSTIAGHFTGHTNNDNLNVVIPKGKSDYTFIEAEDKKASGNKANVQKAAVAMYNAPSVIPVNNPALRVYTYDITGTGYPFGTIRDWNQYYVDLKKANDGGTVKFELEYTASELYGVDHFDGKGLGQAILNVSGDKKKGDLYKSYTNVLT